MIFERVNEPETGVLRWRISWGAVRCGSEAGTLRKDGYITIGIDGKRYQAHRVAWLLHEGHWPDGNPEHENQIKSDNRWVNIKDLAPNQSANGGNQGLRRNNSSGLKGVSWAKRERKWEVHIEIRSRGIGLGYFDDPREAGLHYDAAAKLAWGLRFSHLNFPQEESDHIILSDRVIQKIGGL
jgi:hypothetical protein